MNISDTIELINKLGKDKIPFLTLLDFQLTSPIVIPLQEVNPKELLYDFNGTRNHSENSEINSDKIILFNKYPESPDAYRKKFDLVKDEIQRGNVYLLNLTCSTPIRTNLDILEIFYLSTAKYKILFKDRFACFSPEIFVKIIDGKISSYPMKGTIDASIPNAEKIILEDKKEKAEHYTVVDLIRNDLNMVSDNVKVEKFRYFDRVSTNSKTLIQVSSIISGKLGGDYYSRLGEIIISLLPAGSVTGAPKKMTVEIIKRLEDHHRGFYTGVAGIFDGVNFDSGVMIRFIQQENSGMTYKSGGGITSFSNCESEYNEMIDKVYLPLIK
jgi:para-aminobenzoate synthetase component I